MDDIIVAVVFEPEIVTTGPAGLPSTITWPDILDVPELVQQLGQVTTEGYLTVDANGDLVVTTGGGGVSSWNDLTDRPSQLTQLASLTDPGLIAIDNNGDLYLASSSPTDWADITNKPIVFPSDIANVSGLSTALASKLETETDPVFTASAASGITSTNIANWNTAYGWGDHEAAGYALAADVTTALGTKQDTLVSGTNIKSINGQSILTSGDLNLQTWQFINNYTKPDSSVISVEYDDSVTANNTKVFATNLIVEGMLDVYQDIFFWTPSLQVPGGDLALVGGVNQVVIRVDGNPSDSRDLTTKGYVDGQVNTKQDELVSGTNIKTINGESVLGTGNITIAGGGGGGITWSTENSNFTAAVNSAYIVKGDRTVTLPATAAGDQIIIAAQGAVTILRSTNTIAGQAEDLTLAAGETVYLVASANNTLEVV